MKNWIIILLIFAVPLGLYAYLKCNVEPTEKTTIAYASEAKPKVIKFYSPMCSDCKKIEKELFEVYPDYQDEIILEEINVQKSDKKTNQLIKKYKVTLVPTLIFETAQGQIIKKQEGYMPSKEIEENIKVIK